MRVKCANCGMIYAVNPSSMEFRTESEVLQAGTCPKCKSNAKDIVSKTEWRKND